MNAFNNIDNKHADDDDSNNVFIQKQHQYNIRCMYMCIPLAYLHEFDMR